MQIKIFESTPQENFSQFESRINQWLFSPGITIIDYKHVATMNEYSSFTEISFLYKEIA